MTTFTPRVCDISHYEWIDNDNGFGKAQAAGLWGIISKATQGTSSKDQYYLSRRVAAKKAGLLYGSYHFNDGENVQKQVDYYLAYADPQPDELVCLDYEANPASDMSINQAVEFLHRIEEKLGRKAVIYSGNKLKETISRLSATDQAYVASHRLWLAQYSYTATLPHGFKNWWLWQYTGDGAGPTPHWVNGITAPGNKGLDLNIFSGTLDELKATWSGLPTQVANVQPTVVAPSIVPSVPVANVVPTPTKHWWDVF
jgi:lysozyme